MINELFRRHTEVHSDRCSRSPSVGLFFRCIRRETDFLNSIWMLFWMIYWLYGTISSRFF
jgi:hypothetical protein